MTATLGNGVSCIIGGCEWRFDGGRIDEQVAAIEAHRAEEHDYIPTHRFSVRSDEGRAALEAMDDLFTQRELLADANGHTAEIADDEPSVATFVRPRGRAPVYTREIVIERLQAFEQEHGRIPVFADVRKGTNLPSESVMRRLGRDRYAECQREILRLERELGIDE